jgi:hypothetical protein
MANSRSVARLVLSQSDHKGAGLAPASKDMPDGYCVAAAWAGGLI